jgi:hypothetical protein
MDRLLSRPYRWRAAIDRAKAAAADVRGLQDEQQELLDQIEVLERQIAQLHDQASEPLSRFESSVVDLICLQSEYDCWTVPENLSESRLQDKILEVTSFDFKRLQEYSACLDEFEVDRAFDVLWEAEECSLPKGYGRD